MDVETATTEDDVDANVDESEVIVEVEDSTEKEVDVLVSIASRQYMRGESEEPDQPVTVAFPADDIAPVLLSLRRDCAQNFGCTGRLDTTGRGSRDGCAAPLFSALKRAVGNNACRKRLYQG